MRWSLPRATRSIVVERTRTEFRLAVVDEPERDDRSDPHGNEHATEDNGDAEEYALEAIQLPLGGGHERLL